MVGVSQHTGGVGDGRAESAWTAISNGLDVQLRGYTRR